MKKIKCKVCGAKFAADKEAKYLAAEQTPPLAALTSAAKSFEYFDCPACGCQNAVGIRMAPALPDQDEEDDFNG